MNAAGAMLTLGAMSALLAGMVHVPAGDYLPIRGMGGMRMHVAAFEIDAHAVSGADYLAFVRQESPARRDPPYPPAIRLANVIFSGLNENATAKLALDAAEWVRALLASQSITDVTVVGPAPCPVDRIKKRWRWHLLLKSQKASALSNVGRYFVERFPVPASHSLRVAFDRDPVSLL